MGTLVTKKNETSKMNQALQVWSLGLLNSGSKKFLSQETIGDQLNASAALFRFKQTFTLEQEGDISYVAIKTPRGGYIHAAQKGELRGTAATKVLKPLSLSKFKKMVPGPS